MRPAKNPKVKVAATTNKRDRSANAKITQTLIITLTTEMSSAGNPSSAASPTWANTSGPLRPSVEDHTGRGGTGMDELLQPVSTLDEPVKETIMRDVRAVGAKLRAVLIPLDRAVSCSAHLSTDKYASLY